MNEYLVPHLLNHFALSTLIMHVRRLDINYFMVSFSYSFHSLLSCNVLLMMNGNWRIRNVHWRLQGYRARERAWEIDTADVLKYVIIIKLWRYNWKQKEYIRTKWNCVVDILRSTEDYSTEGRKWYNKRFAGTHTVNPTQLHFQNIKYYLCLSNMPYLNYKYISEILTLSLMLWCSLSPI